MEDFAAKMANKGDLLEVCASLYAQSRLSQDSQDALESLATVSWAEQGDGKYVAAWNKAKVALEAYSRLSSGSVASKRSAYVAMCRQECKQHLDTWFSSHPLASASQRQEVVKKEIMAFRTKISPLFSAPSKRPQKERVSPVSKYSKRSTRPGAVGNTGTSLLQSLEKASKEAADELRANSKGGSGGGGSDGGGSDLLSKLSFLDANKLHLPTHELASDVEPVRYDVGSISSGIAAAVIQAEREADEAVEDAEAGSAAEVGEPTTATSVSLHNRKGSAEQHREISSSREDAKVVRSESETGTVTHEVEQPPLPDEDSDDDVALPGLPPEPESIESQVFPGSDFRLHETQSDHALPDLPVEENDTLLESDKLIEPVAASKPVVQPEGEVRNEQPLSPISDTKQAIEILSAAVLDERTSPPRVATSPDSLPTSASSQPLEGRDVVTALRDRPSRESASSSPEARGDSGVIPPASRGSRRSTRRSRSGSKRVLPPPPPSASLPKVPPSVQPPSAPPGDNDFV